MLIAQGYRTKKDLKSKVGYAFDYYEVSHSGRDEYYPNGCFTVVGPSAYNRRWYAQVTLKDGVIVKVT